MKIIRFYEYGEPDVLKVEEIDPPKPKEGEVLVKTEAIGVNYNDLSRRRNTTRVATPLPFTPGLEIVGTVVETGSGVTTLSPGAKVIGLLSGGGYAEYVALPVARTLPFPAGIDPVEAVALLLQGLTAYKIVASFGHLHQGERIFIQAAAGGVGSLAVQLAKVLGAGQIIAGASAQIKLDLALSLGADVGINYTQTGWTDRVLEASEGKGVDLILDMLGGSTFSENFSYLAPFGRIVTFGAASGQRAVIDAEKLTSRCHTVTGYFSGFFWAHPDLFLPDLNVLFQYVRAGQVKALTTHRFPLEEAAEAHRQMEARQTTGKVILFPSSGQ